MPSTHRFVVSRSKLSEMVVALPFDLLERKVGESARRDAFDPKDSLGNDKTAKRCHVSTALGFLRSLATTLALQIASGRRQHEDVRFLATAC